MTITAAQIRGARAMLNMKQSDLAAAAGISNKALTSIETEAASPRAGTKEKLRAVLEEAGAIFIDTDAGAGVLITRGD
jgi:DNA-binding XRE family transcriptional regulator